MSWFDTAGIASFAKSALSSAQKTIDKALDIQEEKVNLQEKKAQTKKNDADSFFEAFGLSDKPFTTQPPSKLSENTNITAGPSSQQEYEIYAQGSGFWGDTWGSFFEVKGQNPPQFQPKTTEPVQDVIAIDNNQKKDDAVLSQPHRASPFPGDSPAVQASASTPDLETDVKKLVQSVDLPEKGTQDVTEQLESTGVKNTTDCGLSGDTTIVTVQPSCEPIPIDSSISTHPSSNLESNNADQTDNIDETQPVIESTCDNKPVNNEFTVDSSSSQSNVPVNNLVPSICSSKALDQSEFLHLEVLSSAKNVEEVEEHDGPESSKNENSSNFMAISSGSFTQLSSSEAESPSKCFSYDDNNSSTLIIPDMTVGVSVNVANWECCAVDALPSELFTTSENENSDFLVNQSELQKRNLLPQVPSTDTSFHKISVESFDDNHMWSKAQKASQSMNESPNSSNGERNSHHSYGSSNSSKDDDDTDTAEVKEYDAKSTSSSGSHTTTSSSSFVKCSVEDNDNSHRGQSPVSTTASERSDVTKQESEQNTSGDENETATSSDIEILSPPNGENGDRNTSPLKHVWLSRPLRFRRSESPTSDSSKDSMMPVVSELEEVSYEGDTGSPTTLYDDKELGCHKHFGDDDNLGRLLQKQDELQAILDAREKKIVELSKENIELQENEQRLKNLMQKMRVEQAKESRDITSLTREFSQKLSLVEEQLKETVKERNYLQNQLESTKLEIDDRVSSAEFEKVVKEKDKEIAELIEEGQKLSKNELKHTTIIKKLRAKEKEMEKTIKSQSEKLEENSKEVDRLRKSIDAKEEQEKKHIDAIRNLSNTVKKLDKEVSTFKSDLEDRTEKELSLKISLDSTYKDFTELQKAYATKEKEVEELRAGLELKAEENLQQMLDNANKEALREKESLLLQMQELRCTMSRSEEEANSRERMFKAEIASLQKRLQEAEERNEDLSKNMSSATRPLIRQIENLQATFTTQTISWEKIEKNLTDRLSDAENQVALGSEKERAATEKYLEFQSKLTALELQNSTLRQEKLKLSAEIETLKTNIVVLEENKSRETYTLEKVKQNFNSEIKKLKQEKANLETTMATCIEQLDFEKRKVHKLEEEIKLKDVRASIISGSSPCPSPTGSARSSISSIHNWSQDESHEHGMVTPVNTYRMSVYDSLRLGSGSSLLENLQSQLKQREGEIIQLQSEIAKLEQVKESMTRELVQLTEQNEVLDKQVHNLGSIEKEFKDLDQKYNTLLQMYGEKVEETEELQLDLADVKSMYKAQIEELLMKK